MAYGTRHSQVFCTLLPDDTLYPDLKSFLLWIDSIANLI